MNCLLRNAVIFSSTIGVAYSLWLGDELFAFAFFVNALTALSQYAYCGCRTHNDQTDKSKIKGGGAK